MCHSKITTYIQLPGNRLFISSNALIPLRIRYRMPNESSSSPIRSPRTQYRGLQVNRNEISIDANKTGEV